MLENLITKENGWLYVNLIVIYLVLFNLPTSFNDSSLFVVFTFGLFISILKVSSLETLHNFLFKRLLAGLEVELRKINPDYDFYNLKKEAQEEVDKIDKYFHSHAMSFSSLLLASVMQLISLLLQVIGVMPFKSLTIQTLAIYSHYITAIIILINILVIYDDFRQIKDYMFVNCKRVYEKYGC